MRPRHIRKLIIELLIHLHNIIIYICHDRDTYHYSVTIDSCSEFNYFLKALCSLCLLLYLVVINLL